MNLQALKLGKLVLVLGGARSGKSRFAQDLAAELGGDDVLFLATAEASDDEMTRRIEHHRQSRSASWQTIEQPLDVGAALAAIGNLPRVILLDCLTLLVTNIVLQDDSDSSQAEQRMRTEIEAILSVIDQADITTIIVSGEVGMGLVPETSLGRRFRDLLGWSNQFFASHAAATYFMLAGRAINATAIASTVHQVAHELSSSISEAMPQ